MKLLFVGAALLVSVLRTDAQEYAPSSFGNYNPQLPDSGQPGYPVNAYYGNPPPPPQPQPSPRFLNDLFQTVSAVQGVLGSVKNWFDKQSQRPYPLNPQAAYSTGYNGAPPPPPDFNSQVGVATSPLFNGLAPPPPPQSFPAAGGQAAYTGYYSGAPPPPLPLNSLVPYYGASPQPSSPLSNQAVYSPGSYGAPPPAVNSQAGAPSNSYSGPPLPGASIQVGSSSDNNNAPSPANSQPFNAKLQAPPQNVM